MIFIVTEKVHSYRFAYEYSVFSLKKAFALHLYCLIEMYIVKITIIHLFILNILDCLEKLF